MFDRSASNSFSLTTTVVVKSPATRTSAATVVCAAAPAESEPRSQITVDVPEQPALAPAKRTLADRSRRSFTPVAAAEPLFVVVMT